MACVKKVYTDPTKGGVYIVHVNKVSALLILPTRPLSPLKGRPLATSALGGSPLQGSQLCRLGRLEGCVVDGEFIDRHYIVRVHKVSAFQLPRVFPKG